MIGSTIPTVLAGDCASNFAVAAAEAVVDDSQRSRSYSDPHLHYTQTHCETLDIQIYYEPTTLQ